MNANWYDVLDVEPTASADDIRTAWRAAVADLDPTDRRFRVYNQAAEVLLDPERRARYDAAEQRGTDRRETEASLLARPTTGTAQATDIDEANEPVDPVPTSSTVQKDGPRSLPLVPGWALIGVAGVLALALVLAGVLLSKPSDASVESDTQAAEAAADKAVVPLLSYDAHHLDQSRAAVLPLLTPSFRSQYDKFFQGVVQNNAKGLGTVVRAQYVSSGIVRTGADQVDVLVFVDQKTTNKQHPKTPVVYKSQVTLSMVKSGGSWLIDGLTTNLGGR
jgi:Mce-associated membrane protein